MRNGRDNIFDPAHYAKVSLPLEDAEALPRWCFTAREFYDREMAAIFKRSWVFVGRAEEVARPGDYFTIDIADEPLIVMRDDRGVLHALGNTCQHRGAQMLSGQGNCGKTFACPYHAWTYANDGSLVGAPAMNTTRNFDKRQYGLPEIRIDEWAGFLFVNFDHDAPGLADYLGDLPEQFASYNFADMVLTRRVEYDLDSNWKIYAENSTEIYHTSVVHAGSLGNQEADLVPSRGNWTAIHMPGDETCAVLPEDKSPFPQVATLAGRCKTGTHFCLVYPCVTLCCTHDCMWWLAAYPVAPNRSRLSVGSCFPKETVARPDFAEVVQKYYHRWDMATPEDNAIAALQQRGLRSTLRRAGRMSWKEPSIHEFAVWVKDRVVGEDTRGG